jgi:hypothetical protein
MAVTVSTRVQIEHSKAENRKGQLTRCSRIAVKRLSIGVRTGCVFRGVPINIPGSCRSGFRDDGDQDSGLMPIKKRLIPEC